jgi:hypothetical protein
MSERNPTAETVLDGSHLPPAPGVAVQWVILVGGGYGAFFFEGTEAEAEEMRVHKAVWEAAIARRRRAGPRDYVEGATICCWNDKGFANRYRYADCRCGSCAT